MRNYKQLVATIEQRRTYPTRAYRQHKRGTAGNVLGREYIAETIKKQIAMPRRQQREPVPMFRAEGVTPKQARGED